VKTGKFASRGLDLMTSVQPHFLSKVMDFVNENRSGSPYTENYADFDGLLITGPALLDVPLLCTPASALDSSLILSTIRMREMSQRAWISPL
jgi:hypothetical protein